MAIQITPDPKLRTPWRSKTLWVSAITAVAPLLCPPLAEWIQSDPKTFTGAMGVLFLSLRLVTGGSVTID